VHFKPKKDALGASSKLCQSSHGSVIIGVLEQTNRYVSGIDMLDEMLAGLVDFHDEDKNDSSQIAPAIQIDCQCFVRAFGHQDFPDRFLGRHAVLLLEEPNGNYFFQA